VEVAIRFIRKINAGRIVFGATSLKVLNNYRQLTSKCTEAGGLLFGRHLLDCDHIAVDKLSTPQPGDIRERCYFFRGPQHQKIAVRNWKSSKGTCAYLGNWHTHPEPNPTPSSTDLTDWRNALSNDVFEGDTLYFVIVGTQEISCWEGNRNSLEIKKLCPFNKG